MSPDHLHLEAAAQTFPCCLSFPPLSPYPTAPLTGISGGNLYTMGGNLEGQLGTGDYTNRSSPTLVGTDIWVSGTVSTVAAGQHFTIVVAGVCVCVCVLFGSGCLPGCCCPAAEGKCGGCSGGGQGVWRGGGAEVI